MTNTASTDFLTLETRELGAYRFADSIADQVILRALASDRNMFWRVIETIAQGHFSLDRYRDELQQVIRSKHFTGEDVEEVLSATEAAFADAGYTFGLAIGRRLVGPLRLHTMPADVPEDEDADETVASPKPARRAVIRPAPGRSGQTRR